MGILAYTFRSSRTEICIGLEQTGPVYMYSTGGLQILNVTHPDLVKEIANCKSFDLGKPSYLQKERKALLGRGILTSNGDLWAHQRKVIAPEFFMERVKVY